jgi:uncharacterized protein (TIGR00661 family)
VPNKHTLDKPNILVAPLNWGLGHATRCIPIISALEQHDYVPIIASDGPALQLLQKEFPHLQALEFPSYNIEYAADGADFKWQMIKSTPTIIDAMLKEKKIVKRLVKELDLSGIISDNRLGVSSKKVPSVFMTHQLNVLSGNTTWLSTMLHQHAISKFDECWVPDFETKPFLSYKLGHLKKPDSSIKYIGPLSRFTKVEAAEKYELMVVLSGPEPQRTILEQLLKKEISSTGRKSLFIRGIVEEHQHVEDVENITYVNYMTSQELETAYNESALVLCRSGYSSLMDLSRLGKKCFFIPTPGQYEQEYLAKKLKKEALVPFSKQSDFRIENLLEVDLYKGLPLLENPIEWPKLFDLFQRERELRAKA